MSKIAVVTSDVLSDQMAGPAIRALHIADQLARDHDVILVSTARCTLGDGLGFHCLHAAGRRLRKALADVEIVIFQGFVSYQAPWLMSSDKILVIDLYDPMHFEQLEQLQHRPVSERHLMMDLTVRTLNEQVVRGDFFLCASPAQRNLWLGQLSAFGRVNAETYDRDRSLESLIAICPFGLSEQPPVRTRPAIRGTVDGIGPDDKVILWAGGVYNWFDPLTLVRAVDRLRHDHSDVRLFFLGMKHPNPDVPEMQVAWQTRQLADELGLTGKHVFFNEGWVAYDDRQNFLLDADVGVSTHFQNVETAFSFRTRILDYLWAELPIVSSGGDTFGELVVVEELGVQVGEQDVVGLALGLERVLYDDAFASRCRVNVARVRAQYTWPTALGPLIDFCAAPRRAADVAMNQRRLVRRPVSPHNLVARRLFRIASVVAEGGTSLLVARGRIYLRRILRRGR
jgi:glycosyltransferase involved in cell wall biosynthesis